jgi:hypothetical protein
MQPSIKRSFIGRLYLPRHKRLYRFGIAVGIDHFFQRIIDIIIFFRSLEKI